MARSISFKIVTEAQLQQVEQLKDALTGVKNLVGEINRANSGLKMGGLKTVSTDATKASGSIDKLGESLDNYEAKAKGAETRTDALGNSFEEFAGHAREVQNIFKSLDKDFKRIERANENLLKKNQSLVEENQQLANTLKETKNAINTTASSVTKLDKALDKAGDTDLDEKMDSINKKIQRGSGLFQDFDRIVDGLGKRMKTAVPDDLFEGFRDVESYKAELRELPRLISQIDKSSRSMKTVQDQLAAARNKAEQATHDAALAERKYNEVLNSSSASVRELTTAQKAHERAQSNLGEARKDIAALEKEYDNLTETVNRAQRVLRSLKSLDDGVFSKTQKRQIVDLEDAVESLGRVFKTNSASIRRGWSDVTKALGTQGARLTGLDKLREGAEAMSKFRMDNVAREIGNTVTTLNQAGRAVTNQVDELRRLEFQVGRIESAVSRWRAAEAEIPGILSRGNAAMAERNRLERIYSGISGDMRSGRNTIESRQQQILQQQRQYASEMESIYRRISAAEAQLGQQTPGTSGYLRTQQQVDQLRQSYQEYEQALVSSMQTLNRSNAELRQADAQIDRFNASWAEMRQNMKLQPQDFARTLVDAIRRAVQAANELATALGNRLRSAIQTVANAARAFANSVGTMFAGLQRAVQGIGNAFGALGARIESSMERARRSMLEVTAAGYSLMTIGSQINQFGQQMFRGISRGFNEYMEYDRAVTQAAVAAAQNPRESGTGGYVVNRGVIEDMIFGMQRGSFTPDWMTQGAGGRPVPVTFSAKELAEGAYFYSAAIGQPITESNMALVSGTLNTIMQLARVSETNLETAIKGVMNVAMEFGYDPRDMTASGQEEIQKIAAQLGLLSNISTMEVSDIIETFKMVGPMANLVAGGGEGAGLTDTYLLTFLASEVGLRGGNVGRGVSQAFTSILDPTNKMLEVAGKYFKEGGEAFSAEEFKQYFFDDQGLKGGILGFLQTLSKSEMSSVDQAAMLAELFTSAATRSMIGGVVGLEDIDLEEFLEMMEGNDPFEWLSQAAAENANTVTGWFEYMRNAWFQFTAAITSSISGPLMGGFRIIGEILFSIAQAIKDFPGIGQAIAGIVGFIATLATIGGGALIAAGSLLIFSRTFMTIGGFVLPFIRMMAMAGVALLGLIPIIGLVAVAITAFAVAWGNDFMGMRSAYEGFQERFDMDRDLTPMITRTMSRLAIFGRGFKEFVGGILMGGDTGLANLSKSLNMLFGTTLGPAMLTSLRGLTGALSGVGSGLSEAFGDVELHNVRLTHLRDTFQGFMEQVFLGQMSADSMAGIYALGDALGIGIEDFRQKIEDAGNNFRQFMSIIVGGASIVASAWMNMTGQIRDNLMRIFDAANFSGFFDVFSTLIASIATGMAATFTAVLSVIVEITDKIADLAESLNKAGDAGVTFMGITINMQNAIRALGVAIGVALGANLLMRFGPLMSIFTRLIPLIATVTAGVVGLAGRFAVMAAQILITVGAWAAQAAVMATVFAIKAAIIAVTTALAIAEGVSAAAKAFLTGTTIAETGATLGSTAAKIAATVASWALAAAEWALTTAGAGLIAIVTGLVVGFAGLGAALGAVVAVMGAGVVAVTLLALGFGVLLIAIGAVFILVGAIIAIFATAVAGVMLFATAITDGIGAAFQGLMSFIGGVIDGFQAFLPVIGFVAAGIMKLIGFIGQLFGVGDAFRFLGIAAGVGLGLVVTGIMLVVAGLSVLAAVVILPFALLTAAIMGVVKAIQWLRSNWDEAMSNIGDVAADVGGFIEAIFWGIAVAITESFDQMVLGVAHAINGLMDAVTSIPDWVPGIGGRGGWTPINTDDIDFSSTADRNLRLTLEDNEARTKLREIEALRDKVSGTVQSAIVVALGGDASGGERSTLVNVLDSIGLLDEAEEIAKKYNIDINTAGIDDVQTLVGELMKVPEAADLIEESSLDDVFLSQEQLQQKISDWEKYNNLVNDLMKTHNLDREDAISMANQLYDSWGTPIPVEPTDWEKQLNTMGLEDAAGQIDENLQRVQQAMQNLSQMSLEDWFGALYDPLTGMQDGKSMISYLVGPGWEIISQNIPEEAAPWMNQTEFIADIAASGAPGGTNIAGQNIQKILRDSGALDVVSQQTGIPVEVLLEGVPKFSNPAGFENVVLSDMYQIIQGIETEEVKFRPSIGVDMSDWDFIDAHLGTDVGMTDAGIEWAELNEYAIGQAIAGHDWNLADYIAESWGWSKEEAEDYLVRNNIDPNVITDDLYDGLHQAVVSGNGDFAAITETAYNDISALTNGFTSDVITMSAAEWAKIPDSYKAIMKELGITTIVTEGLTGYSEPALAEIRSINEKFAAEVAEVGKVIADGVDGAMSGTADTWKEVAREVDEATNTVMVTLEDLDGTQVTIPAAEYDAYKASIDAVKSLTDEAEEYFARAQEAFDRAKKLSSEGNVFGGAGAWAAGGVYNALGTAKQAQADAQDPTKNNFGMPQSVDIKVNVDDAEVVAARQSIEAVFGEGASKEYKLTINADMSSFTGVVSPILLQYQNTPVKMKFEPDMASFTSVVSPILLQYQNTPVKIKVEADLEPIAAAMKAFITGYNDLDITLTINANTSNLDESAKALASIRQALMEIGEGKTFVIASDSSNLSETAGAISTIASSMEKLGDGKTFTFAADSSNLTETASALEGIADALPGINDFNKNWYFSADTSNLTETHAALQGIATALGNIPESFNFSLAAESSNLTETKTALDGIAESLPTINDFNKVWYFSADTSNLSETQTSLEGIAAALPKIQAENVFTFTASATNLTATADQLERIGEALPNISDKSVYITAETSNLTEAADALERIQSAIGGISDVSFSINADSIAALSDVSINVNTVGADTAQAALDSLVATATALAIGWTASIMQIGAQGAQGAIEGATGAATAFAKGWTATIAQVGASGAQAAIEGAINAAKAFAKGWTATISVNNNATGPIQTALNMLRDLDGRVATSTIRTVIETVRTSKGATGGRVGSAAMSGRTGLTLGESGWTGMYANQITPRATGGRVMPGELTLVGEQGPELVALPFGSYVYTARETDNMINNSLLTTTPVNPFIGNSGGSGSVTHVNVNHEVSGDTNINIYGDIHIGDKNTADNFFEEIDRRAGRRTQLMRRGMYGADTEQF